MDQVQLTLQAGCQARLDSTIGTTRTTEVQQADRICFWTRICRGQVSAWAMSELVKAIQIKPGEPISGTSSCGTRAQLLTDLGPGEQLQGEEESEAKVLSRVNTCQRV